MTLHIELPETIARQARDLAAREHITLDSLTAQLDHTPHRPTVAERAARVDWPCADEILARVPAAPEVPGDER